jgi:hypothetical protein
MSRVSELVKKFRQEYRLRRDKLGNINRFNAISQEIESAELAINKDAGTVVVFNASTRLANFSLNAAFSMLSSWGLRLSGWRVIHFFCEEGMSRCVLGSTETNPYIQPPCKLCTAYSHHLYSGSEMVGFEYKRDEDLSNALVGKTVAEMMNFIFEDLPLGEIVLPSLRWRMRRHHLEEDETTLLLFREFILSAYHVGKEFSALADRENPDLVLVFNGQMFPEAIVRYLAMQRGIKAISHETGYQPYTAFLTTGEATARKIYLTEEEQTLTEEENRRLDAYLEKRFKGSFSMAGVKFWQNMESFPAEIEEKLAHYDQMVPVFTNVIFDTSQAHANTAFEHMFTWLDAVLEVVKAHPETLFVLRAHPDEMRPNSNKKSKETVQDWVEKTGAASLENLVFIPPLQFVSSYDLIRQSKFVLAYNSSIAIEAILLGKLPVCAGWAWYSEYPVVISPQTTEEFSRKTTELLTSEEVQLPEEFHQLARALVYYQNFRVSIPFGSYLEDHALPGFVRLKSFDIADLNEQEDPAVKSLLAGIRNHDPVVKLEREDGN